VKGKNSWKRLVVGHTHCLIMSYCYKNKRHDIIRLQMNNTNMVFITVKHNLYTVHTYISYHFVGPQNLLYKQSDMKLVRKKQHKQRNKNAKQKHNTKTQYKTGQIYRCQYHSLQIQILCTTQ
jgi:hypothetical protein